MDKERPLGHDTDRDEQSGPPTSEIRIAAVEAAVAAGLVRPGPEDEPVEEPASTEVFELPAWTDPPTGQVPRILLEDPVSGEVPSIEPMRGPTWRQDRADWEDTTDLSYFVEETEVEESDNAIAGRAEVEESPFSFTFETLEEDVEPAESEGDELEAAWAPMLASPGEAETLASERRRHRQHSARRTRPKKAPAARNNVVATLTGLGMAGVVVACLLLGPLATLVLAAVALAVTAGEGYAAVQGAGYRPATAVGLVAVPALVVAAYLHQAPGIVVVGAGAFVAVALFHLLRPSSEPLVSMATTLFMLGWVGGLGAFAGLLLAPASFGPRHGVPLLLGALVLTVAHDVGSYVAGSRFGRRRLAPNISPGKTIEGFIGGSVLTVVIAVFVVALIAPFDRVIALELGIIVSVIAPIGDLCESLVKRDLDVKDMGTLLPGHGGLFDRVDALLFVLPATYCLARFAHL